MTPEEVDGFAEGVLADVWAHFKQHNEWPLKMPIMLALRAKGASYDDVLQSSRGLLRIRSGSDERVYATLQALASVDEVQRLLAPLPALMRLAAQRYIQHHAWAGEQEDPALRITLSDIASLWPSSQNSLLVLRLLKECAASPLQYGGSTGPDAADVYLRPSLDSLRHENVETLDDVLRAAEGPERVTVGRYPASNHLRVLQLIWAEAEKNGAWPTSLPFAIENRNIGDVRQLVTDLSPRFLKGGFRFGRHDELSLTPQAVEFVDADGQGKATLVAIARAAAEAWIASSAASRVTLSDIATRSGFDIERVRRWSLFLEWERWGNLSVESGREHAFSIRDEACLKNEQLETWSDYMSIWHPEEQRRRASGDASVQPVGSPEQSLPSLSFLRSESLRRVIEADFAELNALRASGASKAIFVIAGSLIEGVLIDVLSLRPDLAEGLLKKNHAKWPKDAGLSDLIEGSEKFGLIQPSVVSSLQVLKNYRDLIHPVNMSTTKLRARPDTARLVLEALNVVLHDLEDARLSGRLTAYQQR